MESSRKWSGLGALGAAVGVALSWLCCLPFVAALGAGVAAAGSILTPFQPLMAVVSLVLLAVTLVQTVRAPSCNADGRACSPSTVRRRWVFLAVVTLATLLMITLPFWSAHLIYWSL